jgi:hypothetical protein
MNVPVARLSRWTRRVTGDRRRLCRRFLMAFGINYYLVETT